MSVEALVTQVTLTGSPVITLAVLLPAARLVLCEEPLLLCRLLHPDPAGTDEVTALPALRAGLREGV